jgi:hypothetical protein
MLHRACISTGKYNFYHTFTANPYSQSVAHSLTPLRHHHQKMPSGSCFCGNIKIEYNAERTIAVSTQNTTCNHVRLYPLTFRQGLCHCLDCRKLSGSPYTFNFIAKRSELKVIGTPKAITKTADSENAVVNYFCSACGETNYDNGCTLTQC